MIARAPVTHTIKIPGEPVPWKRTAYFNGRRLTPERCGHYKSVLRSYMMLFGPKSPLRGPLRVDYLFVHAPTKEDRKRKRGRRWCAKNKGDSDNLQKAINDAGNGLVWDDDRQIVCGEFRVVVGAWDEQPRVEIDVMPVGEVS